MIIRSLKDHPHTFVSVKELADYMEVSPRWIQYRIEKGALPARKFGRIIKIQITDAQRFVASACRTGHGRRSYARAQIKVRP